LQLRKSTENLSQGRQVVLDIRRCLDIALLGTASTGPLSNGTPRMLVGDFSRLLVGTSVFQVAEIRGSLHQKILSPCFHVVGEKVESPIFLQFACYQGALVAMKKADLLLLLRCSIEQGV
jgi:hypothetical protein